MADLYSREMTGFASRPVVKASANDGYGARSRRFRATITLASQPTADNILLGVFPAGSIPEVGFITSSVSLGTAVIAIGTSKTHASNGQYRAAAVFTAVDTPAPFGAAARLADAPLAADTPVYLTIATAALPASGTLVIDLNCSNG